MNIPDQDKFELIRKAEKLYKQGNKTPEQIRKMGIESQELVHKILPPEENYQTEASKDIINAFGQLIDTVVTKPVKTATDYWIPEDSPNARDLGQFIGELAMFKAAHGTGKKVKSKVFPKKPSKEITGDELIKESEKIQAKEADPAVLNEMMEVAKGEDVAPIESAKAKELTTTNEDVYKVMESELSEGETGGKTRIEGKGIRRYPSTNAEWLRELNKTRPPKTEAFTKKEIHNYIRKQREGERPTDKQKRGYQQIDEMVEKLKHEHPDF